MPDKTIIDPIDASLDDVAGSFFKNSAKSEQKSGRKPSQKSKSKSAQIIDFPGRFRREDGEFVPCLVSFVWNTPYGKQAIHNVVVESGNPDEAIQEIREKGGQYFEVSNGEMLFLPWPPVYVRITEA